MKHNDSQFAILYASSDQHNTVTLKKNYLATPDPRITSVHQNKYTPKSVMLPKLILVWVVINNMIININSKYKTFHENLLF